MKMKEDFILCISRVSEWCSCIFKEGTESTNRLQHVANRRQRCRQYQAVETRDAGPSSLPRLEGAMNDEPVSITASQITTANPSQISMLLRFSLPSPDVLTLEQKPHQRDQQHRIDRCQCRERCVEADVFAEWKSIEANVEGEDCRIYISTGNYRRNPKRDSIPDLNKLITAPISPDCGL